ncbi:MAG: hypothetical protein A3J79_07640 [Elusimicrobia bacterium RIFOXYB2_FULL_62_6]|nr:MAG: hypothetical protein A3J79_07640 [Elusimicrobia bacterium RIFOXYB2_FULL_62_6]
MCSHPTGVWWTPKGTRALIASYNEGAVLFLLEPSSASLREIPLSGMTKYGEEIVRIPEQRPAWSGDNVCRIRAGIRCSYDASKCVDNSADLRKYELTVDLSTLKAKPVKVK